MNTRNLLTLAAVAMACLVFSAASANAAIIIEDETTMNGPGGAISTVNFGNYDASGADKLVVLVGGGRDRGTPLDINSVTYDGNALDLAVKASSSDTSPQGVATGIYYLDSPGAAGDIVVNFAAKSWGIRNAITVLELSGTEAGVGPVASDNNAPSVSLSTLVDDSLVLAISKAVPDSATEVPQAPLVNLNAGSRIGSGYQFVASPSLVTPSFSGWVPNEGGATVAAAFAAIPEAAGVPEPGTAVLATLGLVGLIGFGRRSKRRASTAN